MTVSHLLYLDTHRLTAYVWRHGKLVLEETFDPTPQGFEYSATYLHARPNRQFRILANVGEEGHQIELIPFLRGKDRATLLERKLGQIFFGSSLATARSLGYEKTKRKNERLLLSALTNQAFFQPWLNILAAAETPLAGLYSVSQLSGALLAKLGKIPPRCLLVTMQDHSLRESFLIDGVAVFSRMAPLADSSIAGIAAGMATEATKLHQYLVGQRQIGRNDSLPVVVLAHTSALTAVRTACVETAGLHYVIHDLVEVAARVGLRQPPEDSRCDGVFLHLLASMPPSEQFLPRSLRHDFRIHQTKRLLLASGFAALASAALFAAWSLLATYNHHQETQAFARDEAVLARRYQEVLATFPQIGISNDALRQFAQRHQAIERVRRQPAVAYRYLSQAMDISPAIELDAIEWKVTSPAAQDATPGKAGLLNATEEVAIVRGVLRLPTGTPPRQVVAAFDEFVRQLSRDPAANVSVVQQPFDTEPGRTLRGSTDERSPTQAPTFSVRIAWRLPT